jgi:hypothetical protein
VRTIPYRAIAFPDINYGEYAARCDCCSTFRNTAEDVVPNPKYDNKVRDLVLERMFEDGMSSTTTRASFSGALLQDHNRLRVADVCKVQNRCSAVPRSRTSPEPRGVDELNNSST